MTTTYFVGLKGDKPTLSKLRFINGIEFPSLEEAEAAFAELATEWEKTNTIHATS